MEKVLKVIVEKQKGIFPLLVSFSMTKVTNLVCWRQRCIENKRTLKRTGQKWPTNFLSRLRCRSRGSVLNRCRKSERQNQKISTVKCIFDIDCEAAIVLPSDLQQCNPNEDASHHRQVVLKPFLKLRDAAFNVDEVPLLRVLGKDNRNKTIQPLHQVERGSLRPGL